MNKVRIIERVGFKEMGKGAQLFIDGVKIDKLLGYRLENMVGSVRKLSIEMIVEDIEITRSENTFTVPAPPSPMPCVPK